MQEKVLVIEDLISTGGSSLQAIHALRELQDAEVIALGAIFTYSFPTSIENFVAADCPFFTLTDYPTMLKLLRPRAI
jgi:orotate phosphoribosyltransferase